MTPVNIAPSPVIPLDNVPNIQQDIQLAVKDEIGAAIPAIVEQLKTDQPTPNPSRNVDE